MDGKNGNQKNHWAMGLAGKPQTRPKEDVLTILRFRLRLVFNVARLSKVESAAAFCSGTRLWKVELRKSRYAAGGSHRSWRRVIFKALPEAASMSITAPQSSTGPLATVKRLGRQVVKRSSTG